MRAEPPKITIVTPSLNQGNFVESTVRSVILQRYPNLEYILMDGGSTDDTLERLRKYRGYFAHFHTGPDGGQSAAIAKGFELSTGEIMAYLNSDDVLLPGALHFVAECFRRNPGIDFIYGHRCIIDEGNTVIGHWILPPHCNFLMRRWDLIPQESCFWRKRLFDRCGNIDTTFRFAMDYELFVRYMKFGVFRRVRRFVAAFRVHQDSKTSTQLSTIGVEEVKKVQKLHNIKYFSPLMGKMFMKSVQWQSAYFLRRRSFFPGLAPGINFTLNQMWGGTLENHSDSHRYDNRLCRDRHA